jgi:hypothetical protein
MARDWQGAPARVRARQRWLRCMWNLLCIQLWSIRSPEVKKTREPLGSVNEVTTGPPGSVYKCNYRQGW